MILANDVKIGERSKSTNRRWWGPAREIDVKPVISYEYRANRSYNALYEQLQHLTYQQYINRVVDCTNAILSGCAIGVENYVKHALKYFPSRTGALRKNVAATLRRSAWNARAMQQLPVTIMLGAPDISYATVVNSWQKQFVQVRHAGGLVMSGRGNKYPYESGTGDPEAHYRPFNTAAREIKKHVKAAVRDEVKTAGVESLFFTWLVYEKEHDWRAR